MKNVSSIKSQGSSESPKTPGGISKSLLTPCRRVGLSRKWKKSSVSPFVSPLAGSPCTPEVQEVKKESRKRKERVNEEDNVIELSIDTTPVIKTNSLINIDERDVSKQIETSDLSGTPSRLTVEAPRKKKSKTLLSALNKIEQNIENVTETTSITENNKTSMKLVSIQTEISNNCKSTDIHEVTNENGEFKISKPVKSRSITKKSLSYKARDTNKANSQSNQCNTLSINSEKRLDKKPKETSPKELKKECIVVIQKKIFKTDKTEVRANTNEENLNSNTKTSQDILYSDDDVPLCQISKKEEAIVKDNPIIIKDDDDEAFSSCSKEKPKVKKLIDKKTSTGDLKANVKKKKELKLDKVSQKTKPSQISFNDDDDDFDFSSKKTILIKKTYNKVEKPLKAKSTGSITQKDIDDLKARIEIKKKMLLAQSMEDTEELRGLIKKWQKGCQDALVELMDLMRKKFPDKQFMDYSEILQMLKIPAPLVGYDSDNDCFNTPDDATILLSKFNE